MTAHKKKPDIELECHLCGKKYMASYRAKTSRKYCDECKIVAKKSTKTKENKKQEISNNGRCDGDYIYM